MFRQHLLAKSYMKAALTTLFMLITSVHVLSVPMFFGDDIKIEPGVKFTLKKDSEASTEAKDLSIKLDGVGRTKKDGFAMTYCDVSIKEGKRTRTYAIRAGAKVPFEDHIVEVTDIDFKMDSDADDPWADSSCSFIVTSAQK